MLSSRFIPGGNPLEFVTTGPTRLQLPPSGSLEVYQELTAASTLSAEDSGKTFFLDSGATAGFTTTLPAPFFGARFMFIVKRAPTATTGYAIVTNGSANIFRGSIATADVNSAAADAPVANGADSLTFAVTNSKVGDKIILESDGTSWFLSGFVSLYNAVTVATT